MKKLFLFLILNSAFLISFSQVTTFQKTYGTAGSEEGFNVCPTPDGGYIVSGFTDGFGDPIADLLLIKVNSLGDTIWTRVYGGTAAIYGDYGTQVIPTSDGGYMVVGAWDGLTTGGVLLLKTDASGDTLWIRRYGSDSEWATGVVQTSDDGYAVSALTSSIGAGNWDIYLFKTDATGALQWDKTYGGVNADGGQNNTLQSLQQTSDGGFIIGGHTGSFGAGSYDFYLIKTNATGDTLWTKAYGSSSNEIGSAVLQTLDGGYIISGSSDYFGSGLQDMYAVKTDASGNVQWSRTYGSPSGYEIANGVQQTSDSGYVFAGWTDGSGAGGYDVYLVRTDKNGDTLWTRTYGGSSTVYGDGAYCIRTTSDGGFVISGEYDDGSGLADVYLIKTDSLGYSGCSGMNSVTVVTSPATIIYSTATQINSFGNVTGTFGIQKYSGMNDSTLCFLITSDLTEEENEVAVSVSPNPFSTTATLKVPATPDRTAALFEMYNVLGEKVAQRVIPNEVRNLTLERGSLLSGIYFWKVTGGNIIATGKVVIE